MTNDVKNTFNSTKKEERINKVIALLQKYPRLNSAHAIVTAYKTEYDEEIERSTVSRYLSTSQFIKKDGYYQAVLKDEDLKKEALLSTLLNDAHVEVVCDYELLFLTLDSSFSTTIAHYLENHTALKPFILAIIPHQASIMIFCKSGYKDIVQSTILNLKA